MTTRQGQFRARIFVLLSVSIQLGVSSLSVGVDFFRVYLCLPLSLNIAHRIHPDII